MDREIMALLNKAVSSLERNDRDEYDEIMKQVRSKTPLGGALEGEILLLSVVAGEVAPGDMLPALKMAETLIGGPSVVLSPQSRFAENHYNAFTLCTENFGIAEYVARHGDSITRAMEILQRLTGFGEGVMACHLAQLAFYRGDFETALSLARAEISRGADGQISLTQVYMLEVMAGVARHRMDRQLWHASYGKLRAVVSSQQNASRACREQAEVICAMLEMSLGCLHDVPAWARTGDFGVIPVPHGYEINSHRLLAGTLPGAMVVYMEYLAYSGEPERALQAAALIRRVLGIGNTVLNPYISLLCAGCYFGLKKEKYAYDSIRDAMKYIAPDGMWLIAAEFVPAFGEALYAVAREFDEAAPEIIRTIGEGFWDKLAPLRNEMLRGTVEGLTKREQQVADLVMKGHSNAEIAEMMNVSVRTVKFHLENIYQKLNITRRSKFVGDIEQRSAPKLANWVK